MIDGASGATNKGMTDALDFAGGPTSISAHQMESATSDVTADAPARRVHVAAEQYTFRQRMRR